MTTTRLLLPEIAAGQAQKHVTHNEALLRLDVLVQLSAISRSVAVAPGAPAEGDRYIVPAGAAGAWAGMDGRIAAWTDAGWMFFPPRAGWVCFIEDEGLAVFSGSAWGIPSVASPSGASAGLRVIEELVTLTGASIDTAIAFPARAIVLGVSTRTVEAVAGAVAYHCGIAGEPQKFGGSLGTAVGSNNIGVIGPTAVYGATPVRLTASGGGGSFTAGKVRVALQYLAFTAPAV